MGQRKPLSKVGNGAKLTAAMDSAKTDQVESSAPVKAESSSEAATRKKTTPQTAAKSKKPPSRMNTKAITGHFDPSVSKQLKMLAVTQDSSIQELLREAINDLFTKHGKNPIA